MSELTKTELQQVLDALIATYPNRDNFFGHAAYAAVLGKHVSAVELIKSKIAEPAEFPDLTDSLAMGEDK